MYVFMHILVLKLAFFRVYNVFIIIKVRRLKRVKFLMQVLLPQCLLVCGIIFNSFCFELNCRFVNILWGLWCTIHARFLLMSNSRCELVVCIEILMRIVGTELEIITIITQTQLRIHVCMYVHYRSTPERKTKTKNFPRNVEISQRQIIAKNQQGRR